MKIKTILKKREKLIWCIAFYIVFLYTIWILLPTIHMYQEQQILGTYYNDQHDADADMGVKHPDVMPFIHNDVQNVLGE
jgi:hypothetical protein